MATFLVVGCQLSELGVFFILGARSERLCLDSSASGHSALPVPAVPAMGWKVCGNVFAIELLLWLEAIVS